MSEPAPQLGLSSFTALKFAAISAATSPFSANDQSVVSLPCSLQYLESQNSRPFFNRKSSFFRGNSPLSLHFNETFTNKVEITLQFAVLWTAADATSLGAIVTVPPELDPLRRGLVSKPWRIEQHRGKTGVKLEQNGVKIEGNRTPQPLREPRGVHEWLARSGVVAAVERLGRQAVLPAVVDADRPVPELGQAGRLAADGARLVGQRGDLLLEHRGVDLARVKVPGAPALLSNSPLFVSGCSQRQAQRRRGGRSCEASACAPWAACALRRSAPRLRASRRAAARTEAAGRRPAASSLLSPFPAGFRVRPSKRCLPSDGHARENFSCFTLEYGTHYWEPSRQATRILKAHGQAQVTTFAPSAARQLQGPQF